MTATHGRESLVAQIVSADKPVTTVRTTTNVAQAKSVVMAATVCHCALLTLLTLLTTAEPILFGTEVLLPQL